MRGRGIVRMRWLNWIVFDHLLMTMAQLAKKMMSPRPRCFASDNARVGQRRLPNKLARMLRAKDHPSLAVS